MKLHYLIFLVYITTVLSTPVPLPQYDENCEDGASSAQLDLDNIFEDDIDIDIDTSTEIKNMRKEAKENRKRLKDKLKQEEELTKQQEDLLYEPIKQQSKTYKTVSKMEAKLLKRRNKMEEKIQKELQKARERAEKRRKKLAEEEEKLREQGLITQRSLRNHRHHHNHDSGFGDNTFRGNQQINPTFLNNPCPEEEADETLKELVPNKDVIDSNRSQLCKDLLSCIQRALKNRQENPNTTLRTNTNLPVVSALKTNVQPNTNVYNVKKNNGDIPLEIMTSNEAGSDRPPRYVFNMPKGTSFEDNRIQPRIINNQEKNHQANELYLRKLRRGILKITGLWKGHVYMKYGLTLTSSDAKKRFALMKFIQSYIGLNGKNKAQRRQAVLNYLRNELKSRHARIDPFLKCISRPNINLQVVANVLESIISNIYKNLQPTGKGHGGGNKTGQVTIPNKIPGSGHQPGPNVEIPGWINKGSKENPGVNNGIKGFEDKLPNINNDNNSGSGSDSNINEPGNDGNIPYDKNNKGNKPGNNGINKNPTDITPDANVSGKTTPGTSGDANNKIVNPSGEDNGNYKPEGNKPTTPGISGGTDKEMSKYIPPVSKEVSPTGENNEGNSKPGFVSEDGQANKPGTLGKEMPGEVPSGENKPGSQNLDDSLTPNEKDMNVNNKIPSGNVPDNPGFDSNNGGISKGGEEIVTDKVIPGGYGDEDKDTGINGYKPPIPDIPNIKMPGKINDDIDYDLVSDIIDSIKEGNGDLSNLCIDETDSDYINNDEDFLTNDRDKPSNNKGPLIVDLSDKTAIQHPGSNPVHNIINTVGEGAKAVGTGVGGAITSGINAFGKGAVDSGRNTFGNGPHGKDNENTGGILGGIIDGIKNTFIPDRRQEPAPGPKIPLLPNIFGKK